MKDKIKNIVIGVLLVIVGYGYGNTRSQVCFTDEKSLIYTMNTLAAYVCSITVTKVASDNGMPTQLLMGYQHNCGKIDFYDKGDGK